ncbi:MAG: PepSY-like domain-containing protein [Muribaculaceae bacterium]|nr:PepSY-like domain-containing protein [Muribaculaceae bacterium]
MKLIRLAIMAVLALAPAVAARAQVAPSGNPGIVVAGSVNDSDLPQAAKDFINKFYPGRTIASVQKNFLRTEYDVRLLNGVELEFNGKGKVTTIEAPGGTVLPDAVVKALLPHKAYRHLADNGLNGYVEEISLDRRGYEVGLLLENPDEVVYTIEGNFLNFDN